MLQCVVDEKDMQVVNTQTAIKYWTRSIVRWKVLDVDSLHNQNAVIAKWKCQNLIADKRAILIHKWLILLPESRVK